MRLIGFAIVVGVGALAAHAQAAATPVRSPLGDVTLSAPKTVDRVQVMRVDFAAGQGMPRHIHPAPVVCMVERGRFHMEIAGQPARDVGVGAVTYEPAETPVEQFRNTSAQAGSLICDFLGGHDDTELSRPLPPR
jgi:quercetin dioxygenase-like cupin family protein